VPFWVYIIRCADGSYYTGWTDDLARRWECHASGGVDGYTAKRRPLKLVYAEPSRG
jgi:predicted GIY-YIG superfamily endonuclease